MKFTILFGLIFGVLLVVSAKPVPQGEDPDAGEAGDEDAPEDDPAPAPEEEPEDDPAPAPEEEPEDDPAPAPEEEPEDDPAPAPEEEPEEKPVPEEVESDPPGDEDKTDA